MAKRRRKHDDLHRPFGGNGKRAREPWLVAPERFAWLWR